MAVIGRTLEAQGFRVGIIAQPDWQSADPFKALGKPNLFFGVAAGNMDSMINRYTADRKIRSDDAYTPGGAGGKRPDRATLVYAQRCKEAWNDVPIVIGGIEASLRRIAHYDYWQDKVRRSHPGRQQGRPAAVRQCRARHRRDRAPAGARASRSAQITDVRGTAFMVRERPAGARGLLRDRLERGRSARPHRRPHQPLPDDERSRGVAGPGLREGRRARRPRRSCRCRSAAGPAP